MVYALGTYGRTSALLKKEKNIIEIAALYKEVKPLDIPADCRIATGLETASVVRREVSLKLKKEKEILAALAFQIEALIPFPLEEAILVPQIYPDGQTIVFAATKKSLEEHLKQELKPDIVSAVPAALLRWSAFHHPEMKDFYLLHEGTALVVREGRIALSQAYEAGEEERVKAHIFAKWGALPCIDNLPNHAAAIGFALEALWEEGNSLQFLQGPYQSVREKETEKRKSFFFAAASAGLALLAALTAIFISSREEKLLMGNLDKILGPSPLSLEQRIEDWRLQLQEEQKKFPLHAPVVSLGDFLAWISSLQEEITVLHLRYSLAKYPKMGSSLEPYQVKIDLEFSAPTPTVARAMHDSLRSYEKLVDTRKEIAWKVLNDRYAASFYLRNLP